MLHKNNYKKGFTLIELLVVVLIIGILASIALPQYQKAVKKSRLSQLNVTMDAAKKNMDLYVLEHGYETISFTRDDLSIEIPGQWNGVECQNNLGDLRLECSATGYCSFWFKGFPSTVYAELTLIKRSGARRWVVEGVGAGNDTDLPILCQWIRDGGYPAGSADTFNACKSEGITLQKAY